MALSSADIILFSKESVMIENQKPMETQKGASQKK